MKSKFLMPAIFGAVLVFLLAAVTFQALEMRDYKLFDTMFGSSK